MTSGSIDLDRSNAGVAMTGGVLNNTGGIYVNSIQEQFEEFAIPRLITTFEGREKEIEMLDHLFFEKNIQKIVISGLPGFGKTELSKQYASKCKINHRIDEVFWVKAENEDCLRKASIHSKRICNRFKERKTILLVFDNAISRQAICNYEPENYNCKLLITSIRTDWSNDVESIKLGALSADAVVAVYQSILDDKYQESDRQLYEQLAETVGNVPLGLQITGALVENVKTSLGAQFDLISYIQKLKKSRKIKFTSSISPCSPNSYKESIHTAMKISLDTINNEGDSKLRKLALNILYIGCYLNPEFLFLDDLMKILNKIKKTRIDNFKIALNLLRRYCFVNYNPDEPKFNMHRFTQEVLRYHISECNPEKKSKFYRVCLEYVVLKNGNIHFNHVISFADDNVIAVHKLYEKHLSSDVLVIQELFIHLSKNGCTKCLKNLFKNSGNHAKKYINMCNLLHIAINNNHLKTVKLLLKHNADVNQKTNLDDTPLHLAASIWNLEVIEILVTNEADLSAMNYKGDIPLFSLFRNITSEEPVCIKTPFITFDNIRFKAINYPKYTDKLSHAYSNKMNVVSDILDVLRCKEYRDTTNNNGETFLHIVTGLCNEPIVKLLIDKYNMDVNKVNLAGRTPIYSLISRPTEYDVKLDLEKAVSTARVLIMHGAKLDIQDVTGLTLIEFAETKDESNILMRSLCDNRCVKQLKQVFDYLGDRTKDYITKMNFMQYAAHSSQFDVLCLLLQYHVDINQMNPFSPLQAAAYACNSDSIKILLQHKADLNATDHNEETALFYFIHGVYAHNNNIDLNKAIEILELLEIEKYKNVINKSGATLVHASAALCQDELMKLLLENYEMKADVTDIFNDTPLQVFISNLGRRIVRKKSAFNILKMLQLDNTPLNNDDAFLKLLENLITQSGRDMSHILPYLK